MADREGAVPVLNDPQFGLTAILRPYVGFDKQPGGAGTGSYQAVSGIFPIMFTESGIAFDQSAGQTGYSKRLVKGLSVPYGARVVIWLPAFQLLAPGTTLDLYTWQIIWRQRNVFDYRNFRLPFHYPKQGVGIADTTTGDAGSRVVLPSCFEIALFTGTDISTFQNSRPTAVPDGIQVKFDGIFGAAPLIPGPIAGIAPVSQNFGIISQGVTDPFTIGQADTVAPYYPVEMQAKGDELLVACYKFEGTGTWDFSSPAGQDKFFSALFGANAGLTSLQGPFPDVGIYVNVGVAT